jgi:hypothetical protein
VVNKFEDLVEVIIPLFKYAKLRTLKRLDFEDWTKAIEIKKKIHLRLELMPMLFPMEYFNQYYL